MSFRKDKKAQKTWTLSRSSGTSSAVAAALQWKPTQLKLIGEAKSKFQEIFIFLSFQKITYTSSITLESPENLFWVWERRRRRFLAWGWLNLTRSLPNQPSRNPERLEKKSNLVQISNHPGRLGFMLWVVVNMFLSCNKSVVWDMCKPSCIE